MQDERPAFTIKAGDNEYRIYANGRVEGFEGISPLIVINRIPVLLAEERMRADA